MSTTSIQNLIKQLDPRDRKKQREAIKGLIKSGEGAIQKLALILENDSFNDYYLTDSQKVILDVLVSIGDSSIDSLLKLLGRNIPVLTNGIHDALVKIGSSCVKNVTELVRNDVERYRCDAVVILGRIANEEAISVLDTVLRHDSSDLVRGCAAEALASSDNPRALRQISHYIDDIPGVRRYAVLALGKLGDKKAVGSLTAILLDRDNSNGHLVEVRNNAAWALGQIGDLKAIPALLELVANRSYYPYSLVLDQTIVALRKLQDRSAVKPLIEVIKDRKLNSSQRVSACEALGQLRDQRALPALTRLALKGKEGERSAAIQAIGKIAAPWSKETIYEALNDDSALVRKEAVIALGEMGTSADVPSLFETLIHENNEVGRAAFSSIVHIGEAALEFLAAEYIESHEYVNGSYLNSEYRIPFLRRMGETSLKPFLKKIEDKDANKSDRLMAIQAVGSLGFPSGLEPLQRLFGNGQEDSDTNKEIKRAIQAIVHNSLQPLYKIVGFGSPFIKDGIVDGVVEYLLTGFDLSPCQIPFSDAR